jgi:polysaccharide export outer membrane protein
LFLGLVAGCAVDHAGLERALLAARPPAAHNAEPTTHYLVHCPDLLEVTVEGREESSGPRRVEADGRIALGPAGRLSVDGLTTPEIARAAGQRLGVDPERLSVRVAEYNSEQIYVYGEVAGLQRAVPYQGPETVLDLLQRLGGVTPGASIGDIQVVRPHVADGRSPEVFPVDLEAIVVKHDPRTNVALEPFDQVYVGQSVGSRLKPCFPPWLRPIFDAVSGMRRRPA